MAAAFAALQKARENREANAAAVAEAERVMQIAFNRVDTDGGGSLDLEEMKVALSKIGEYDAKAPDAKKVIKMINKAAGEDGTFNFEQFKSFIAKLREEKNKWNVPVPWLPYNTEVAKVYKHP